MIIYKNIFSLSSSEIESLKNIFITAGLQEKIPLLLKQFPQFDEYQIREISQYDPTPEKSKEYTPWLVKMVASGSLRLPEDGKNIFEALQTFHKFKQDPRLKRNDIIKYESPGDLYETIEYFLYFESKTQKRKQYEENKNQEGSELLVDKDGIKIVKVTNVKTAMELSEGTQWCVVNEEYAKTYLRKGPLYFVYKNNQPYALLHVESNQLKNVYDDELEEKYRLELKPYFVENRIIHPKVYDLAILKNYDSNHYIEKDAQMLFSITPSLAFDYAKNVLKGRFPEGEQAIAKDVKSSLEYAKLIGGRFPAGEPVIAKEPGYSMQYAKFLHKIKEGVPDAILQSISKKRNTSIEYAKLIGGRFELGEKAISENEYNLWEYVKILKKRGEEIPEIILERIIEKSWTSLAYAKLIGGRFPAGEPVIAKEPGYSLDYLKILKDIGEEIPEIILQSISKYPEYSLDYAKLIGGRFELGEPAIAKDSYCSFAYAKLIGGRFELGEPVILNSIYKDNYLNFLKQNQPQQYEELMNEIGN